MVTLSLTGKLLCILTQSDISYNVGKYNLQFEKNIYLGESQAALHFDPIKAKPLSFSLLLLLLLQVNPVEPIECSFAPPTSTHPPNLLPLVSALALPPAAVWCLQHLC